MHNATHQMQPPCPEEIPLPSHDPTRAATILWVVVGALIVGVLLADLWISLRKDQTASRVSQGYSRRHHWIAALIVGALTALGLHLVGVL